jgi:cytochrome c
MMRSVCFAVIAALSLTACSKSDEAGSASQSSATEETATPAQTVALSGEAIFKRCAACHKVGAGAVNGLGPILNGISGRAIASVAGFTYSTALKNKGGVWDDASLGAFLTSPAKSAPGTKMAFAGLGDAAERKALIEYLKTQK